MVCVRALVLICPYLTLDYLCNHYLRAYIATENVTKDKNVSIRKKLFCSVPMLDQIHFKKMPPMNKTTRQ